MAVISNRLTQARGPHTPTSPQRALAAAAVADVNWFSTESLFREVHSDQASTLLLKCMDYRNAHFKGIPPWWWRSGPRRGCGPAACEQTLVLPSGWMKRFPRIGMRPIARAIKRWQRDEVVDSRLHLVMTYPHYLYLRDQTRPAKTVYYNIDDYTLYWPRHTERIRALERQAVRESDLTICVAKVRADELRAAVPEAAHRVKHLPHGAPLASVADTPWHRPAPAPADIAGLPRPLIGYIGTVEDRVNWALLNRLSEALPEASLVVVGQPGRNQSAAWYADYERCIARPNVHAIGWRDQASIPCYNRAFDVCLIPYRTDHAFNRVCSPTKIMDSMGSGRPIVSTALPECRLYAHLFDVAENDDGFIAAVRRVVASGSEDGRAASRVEWARANTCRKVVDRMFEWLAE